MQTTCVPLPRASSLTCNRLESLLSKAAKLDGTSHDQAVRDGEDQLLRTLRTMTRIFPVTGKMEFGSDDEAALFATDLRERYGEGIAQDLCAGRTGALQRDFPDNADRRAVAAAFVSAAKTHRGMRLTLREADYAARDMTENLRSQHRDL